MKTHLAMALIGASAVSIGAALAIASSNRPLGGNPSDLLSYQVETIRARRVEIMDDQWRIRMVLTVHRNQPCITFYDEDGEPATVVLPPGAGLVIGE